MKLLQIIFVAVFAQNFQAQNVWMVNSTSDATAESMDIVLDAAGNSYITGYISGDTEFQDIEIDISTGYSDVIVAKIDPQGNYLWVKKFTGPLSDKGIKIALTSTNEIIFTGTFYNSITFGSTTLSSSSGSKDIFLAKLSNSGDVIWARKEGGSLGENVYGLAVDSQDNIVLTGQFEGNATIAGENHSSMINPSTSTPSFDMFLAKYNSIGAPLWSKSAHAEYEDRGMGVVFDNQNNIYLIGQFSENIDFFGQQIANQIYNVGFVSKFSPTGNFLWFNKLAAGQVLTYDLAIDNQNKLVVTGDFLGQLTVWAQEGQYQVTNPYEKKIFVLKFDLTGNYQWGKAHGSRSEVSSRTICTDSQNNIYIGGHFKCNFSQYRDSTGTSHWQSAGFRDQFVTKFNSSGSTIWKNQVGGQREDQCWGIAIKDDDYPIITGSYATNIIYPFSSQYNYSNMISNSLSQNYFYPGFNGVTNSQVTHFGVIGDESINIHVSKMINSNSRYYNYYQHASNQNLSDSLAMFITPNQDSVDFCPPDIACLQTNTNLQSGPFYGGAWNNGTQYNQCVDASNIDGTYSIFVTREDQCYNFRDTVYIDYHPAPNSPLLTDNQLVNISESNYRDLIICRPDSAVFYFQSSCSNCQNSIAITSVGLDETLVLDSNYIVNTNSRVVITSVSDKGCVLIADFFIEFIDSINPYLILDDSYDFNDSIMICKDNPVRVIIADSITNPSGNLISHSEVVMNATISVSQNGQAVAASTTGYFGIFQPQTNGWYHVSIDLTIGIPTCFYQFSLTDSFYVEIKENPQLNFIGGDLLCPDSYNFLSISPPIPNLIWTGPAILWTSLYQDSIRLNESGVYTVSGSFNYGERSCTFFKSILIGEKSPPLVIMNPADGIVCPDDSVLLSLNQNGISYEWIGPQGDLVSTDSATYVVDQGWYACIFTDNDGCRLLTAQAEIREYITPFLVLSPSNILCNFEPVTLNAIFGGLANVIWHSPINSTSSEVIVNQPGTYVCEVSQCGITVIDSLVLINGSFDLQISSSTNSICFGDTAIISATSGLSYYEWLHNGSGSPIFSATESGSYTAIAYNQYGCSDTSNTISINVVADSYPPIISDTFVCIGGDISLNYQSNFPFGWYNSPNDQNPFSTLNSVSFSNNLQDFSLFVAHTGVGCPLNFTEVFVDVLDPLLPPSIVGDSTICLYEPPVFSVNSITNGSYYWVYGNDTISNGTSVSLPNFDENSPLILTIYQNDGCTESQNAIQLELKYPTQIIYSVQNDTLCYGESLFATVDAENSQFYWSDGTNNYQGSSLTLSYFDIVNPSFQVYGINTDDCYSDTLDFEIALSPDADLNLQISDLACVNSEIIISSQSDFQNFIWTYPSGKIDTISQIYFSAVQQENEGQYIASFFNDFNCKISDSINLDVHILPQFSAGSDSILCSENVFELNFPNQNYTFSWEGFGTNTSVTPSGNDPLILAGIDSIGCTNSDTVNIILVDCSGKGANVITANNDGINDYFVIWNSEYSYDNCLVILNRWGNVVYEENYYKNGFRGYTNEGEKLSDGTYFYLFYKDCSNKKDITSHGYIQIISK